MLKPATAGACISGNSNRPIPFLIGNQPLNGQDWMESDASSSNEAEHNQLCRQHRYRKVHSDGL